MKKKKKSRRSAEKYPALKPNLNLKTRQELIDYDYINKLDPESKEWLNKFTAEYVNTDLDRVDLSNNIHNTLQLKQDCDKRNNTRKFDLYLKLKVTNQLDNIDDYKSELLKQEELSNFLNDLDDGSDQTADGDDSGEQGSEDL